jgi:hypothetical protein
MRNKVLSLILSAFILLSSSGVYAFTFFSDLPESHWAYRAVYALVDRGGISGYKDGTFKPSGTITIAEFLKIVVGSTIGKAEPSNKHWASGYFDKALEAKIIQSGEFAQSDWDKAITRQQMAVIIARTLDNVLKEEIAVSDANAIMAKISDFSAVCSVCQDSVIKVYSVGIITGYPDGTFKGGNTATRAEASTMLVRMFDKSLRVGMQMVKIRDYISNWDDYMSNSNDTTFKGKFGNLEEATFIANVDGYEWYSRPTVDVFFIRATDSNLFRPQVGIIIDSKIVEVKQGNINSVISSFAPEKIRYFISYDNGYKDAFIFLNPLYKGE